MMPPTTWTMTAADGSVRTGLTTNQARNALTTLMRGGAVAASKPVPQQQPVAEPQRVAVAAERKLVAA